MSSSSITPERRCYLCYQCLAYYLFRDRDTSPQPPLKTLRQMLDGTADDETLLKYLVHGTTGSTLEDYTGPHNDPSMSYTEELSKLRDWCKAWLRQSVLAAMDEIGQPIGS